MKDVRLSNIAGFKSYWHLLLIILIGHFEALSEENGYTFTTIYMLIFCNNLLIYLVIIREAKNSHFLHWYLGSKVSSSALTASSSALVGDSLNNEMQVFQNSEFGELGVLELDGKPYFPARASAKILGYKDSTNAIKQHCRWVVKHHLPHPQNPSKEIEMNFIPEGHLYRLITHSWKISQ